jgi:hypothetical protein
MGLYRSLSGVEALHHHWRWLLVLGIATMVVGVTAIIMIPLSTLASMVAVRRHKAGDHFQRKGSTLQRQQRKAGRNAANHVKREGCFAALVPISSETQVSKDRRASRSHHTRVELTSRTTLVEASGSNTGREARHQRKPIHCGSGSPLYGWSVFAAYRTQSLSLYKQTKCSSRDREMVHNDKDLPTTRRADSTWLDMGKDSSRFWDREWSRNRHS